MWTSTVKTRPTRLQYSAILAVVCLVMGVGQLSGQNASISAVIQEANSGEPIRGATVFLTGTPLRAVTDAQGQFVLRRLSAGEYDLRVAAMGFAYDSLPSISLTDSEDREVSVSLERVSLRLQEVVITASRVAERSDESSGSIASLPSHACGWVDATVWSKIQNVELRCDCRVGRGRRESESRCRCCEC